MLPVLARTLATNCKLIHNKIYVGLLITNRAKIELEIINYTLITNMMH